MRLLQILSLFLLFTTAALRRDQPDLLLKGGRIVDGTGNPAYFADIAVRNGRVSAIGRDLGDAETVIDCRGRVVAPGFIDVHTHSENVLSNPDCENFLRMGVTTIVTGNCGGSALNIREFLTQLDGKISVNAATLIGHNTVRSAAMGGSFDRAPTEQELVEMQRLVTKAMEDGAAGLSTGLIYLPGTFSRTDEIVQLARKIAPFNGIYASHMRSEGADILNSIAELCTIAREAGVRAEISHIKCSGKPAWGMAPKVLAAIEAARAQGLDITQDQYAYTASSTSLSTLIPSWAREGSPEKFRGRLSSPAEKARILQEMKNALQKGLRDDWGYAVIASYSRDRRLNGKTVPQAAKILFGDDSIDSQIETILTIAAQGGAGAVFHGMHEDDLQIFLKHPNTMIASDSGPRQKGEDVPHPRGYGNNVRVLQRYVRELGLLRLEDAVRRMTSLPAATFRMRDRGTLREGAWADIVVFNPEKLQETTTFSDPHHYAEGFDWVLVNGTPVIENGRHTHARSGRAIRNTQH